MAYVVGPRNDRFTAMYIDPAGKRRSAGTYSTHAEAMSIAEQREKWEERPSDRPDPVFMATVTLSEWWPTFLRLHAVEPGTKPSYASSFHCHIEPRLGDMRVRELSMQQVREWLVWLKENGRSPDTMRRARMVLSAMMGMAVADGYRDTNPTKGLRTPRLSHKAGIPVMTLDQFKSLYAALPTDGARALAYLGVSTGMRFGELTAVRVGDINMQTGLLGVTKAMSDVGAQWNPNSNERFIQNGYGKGGKVRDLTVDVTTRKMIQAYIDSHGLRDGELLFPRRLVLPDRPGIARPKHREPLTPERLAELGTFVAANGITYGHGTINGYVTGKCKCEGCKQAATEYSYGRRKIRNAGKRKPRPVVVRSSNPSDVLGRDAWGRVWDRAVKDAGLPFKPTAYQVRHTSASWLIEAGENPKTVMSRLGHGDLRVTSRYVQVVGTDQSAADIMGRLLA